ncbi:MAG: hypothetical protein B7Z82_09105 [Halothiobacillus sp. 20-54-6]|nr:MAG: hypothetical protein B7Z82_09105 [Halothiobacillus sp. 20-54-6]
MADGAIVEREIPFKLSDLGTMRLSLRNPDFTTAKNMEKAINQMLGGGVAEAGSGEGESDARGMQLRVCPPILPSSPLSSAWAGCAAW